MMTPLAIRSPTVRALPTTNTASYFQRLKPTIRYHFLPLPSHRPNNPNTCYSFHLHSNNNNYYPHHEHRTIHCHRSNPIHGAVESDLPYPQDKPQVLEKKINSEALEWDSLTAKFAASANLPFLLLQLPQILLNAQNLMAGKNSALLAVPWLGMLTGLLGNLSLLSYFAKKREKEAIVVQTLGVISIYVVITQLALAQAMPFYHYLVTSVVVVAGLILNFMNYFNLLNERIWLFWEDFITVCGLTVLPQVMWSTFVPYIPNSILPGALAFVVAVAAVIMARMGKLSKESTQFVGSISGWTATLLFMWMPVSQMWTSYLNPENIKGLSAISMLLAMIGNGLMIPRALYIRNLMWCSMSFGLESLVMSAGLDVCWFCSRQFSFRFFFEPQWFTGATWASFLYGWGNLICMYCLKSISREFFLAATLGLFVWTGLALWKDTKVYGYDSPLRSLKELMYGP